MKPLETSVSPLEKWQEIESDLRNIIVSFLNHYGSSLDADDVMQDVWIVCNDRYDEKRGALLTFATVVGKNIIADAEKAQRVAEKHLKDLYVKSHPDILSVERVCNRYKWHTVMKETLEEKAISPILAQDYWDERWVKKWQAVQVIMAGQSPKAKVLWVMWTHLVEHDVLPSARQIAERLGVSYQRVYQILDEIVEEVERLEPLVLEEVERLVE